MTNNNGSDYRLTEEGLKEYKDELERLKSERQKVAQRLKEAKEAGDLSENAEWSSAMDDYKFVESRIEEVEDVLQHAQVVKLPENATEAQFGSKVTIKDGGPEKEYTLVGSLEADPDKDKISISSPVGQNLVGKKVGDTFQHITPSGETHTYEVKKIS